MKPTEVIRVTPKNEVDWLATQKAVVEYITETMPDASENQKKAEASQFISVLRWIARNMGSQVLLLIAKDQADKKSKK